MSDYANTKIEPHEYEPFGWAEKWLSFLLGGGGRCRRCYCPKRDHPTSRWETARSIW